MSHAPFPPSSAKRWINCTGSYAQGLQLPNPPDSEYSLEGTRLHELAAAYLGPKHTPILAREDQLFLKPYMTHVDELMRTADEWHVERRMWHPLMADLLFGTADFVAISGGWIEVVDLKCGYGVMVDPHENEQLMCYALLMLYDLRERGVYTPDVIRLTIVQPTDDTNPVKTWETTIERVISWGMEAEEAIRKAVGGSTDLVPGEWCRWCRAKPLCPALRGIVAKAPAGEFQMLTDLGDLPYWLDKADLLEQWLDAVRKFAHEHIKAGGEVEGWALKPKRAMRTWDDEEAVLAIARRRKIKIFQDKLLSPAMAERAHKNLPGELTEHIVSISNGTNLVRSDEPGAVKVTTPATPMEQLRANIKMARIKHVR